MHTATITKRLHGRYLVTCPEGCNLGESAWQATREGAERRVKLHQIATTPLVLHGPMRQPCGCPLDADCNGYHPGALDGFPR